MALLSPIFNETHFKSDGTLASGYKIYTYIADSDIAATTYTTEDGDVAQANPIILNARGELDNPIWLSDGVKYKFIFTSNTDVVIKTIDNIIGVSTPDAIQDQWIEFTGTATYISGTSFSVEGDQTSVFDKGRALRLLTSAGTVYANVSTSAFTTLTQINVGQATGLLDSGLTGTKPSYGVLSGINSALPAIVEQKMQNQTGFSATTTGTSSALVFTPSLAYQTPNAAKQAASLNIHVALTGGAVTLQAAGQTALPLILQNGANPVTPINYIARVESNGTSWVITNAPPVVSATDTVQGVVELSTGAEFLTGTSTTLVPPVQVIRNNTTGFSTLNTTTGGTTIAFTSILPAWTNEFTVHFKGASTSGTATWILQVGVGGTYVTAGYDSFGINYSAGGLSGGTETTGIAFLNASVAANSYSGHVTFKRTAGTNIWSAVGGVGGTSNSGGQGFGTIDAGGVLDSVRFNTVGGTNTVDVNGGISVSWSA